MPSMSEEEFNQFFIKVQANDVDAQVAYLKAEFNLYQENPEYLQGRYNTKLRYYKYKICTENEYYTARHYIIGDNLENLIKKAVGGDVQAQFDTAICYKAVQCGLCAWEYYKRAAAQNHAEAQFRLSHCLEYAFLNGSMTLEDVRKEKIEYINSAADNGHAMAQYLCSSYYLRIGNYEQAYNYLLKASNQGHVLAKTALAIMHLKGQHVGISDNSNLIAITLLKEASEPKDDYPADPEAQYLLADLYFKGEVTAQDNAQGQKYLELAVNNQHERARFDKGRYLLEGSFGYQVDYKTASECFMLNNNFASGNGFASANNYYIKATTMYRLERIKVLLDKHKSSQPITTNALSKAAVDTLNADLESHFLEFKSTIQNLDEEMWTLGNTTTNLDDKKLINKLRSDGVDNFKDACTRSINVAASVLDNELGWTEYLSNLLKSIANMLIYVVSFGTANKNSFFNLNHSPDAQVVAGLAESLAEEDKWIPRGGFF